MVERWGSEAEAAGPGNSFLLFYHLIIFLLFFLFNYNIDENN